jgi:hypothetical protein
MEAQVADGAASPMKVAAFSFNSKRPALFIVLPNDHHLLQNNNTSRLSRRRSKPSITVIKKSKNVNRTKSNCQFDWYLCQKCFDTQHNGRLGANERKSGPKKVRDRSCRISKERFTKATQKLKKKKIQKFMRDWRIRIGGCFLPLLSWHM